jgi:ACS family D-galactonate transporter-like MFS transporter
MQKSATRQWILLFLLVVSIGINYIDRSNLSVAATDLSSELNLSRANLGLLLGAFFWTYAIFQLVAGWAVDRYNVYMIYGVAFLLWSAATGLIGFAGSLASLFTLRLVLGMSESIAYPAYSRFIACEFPARHRGLANAAIDAGAKAGPALGTLMGGLIVAHYGWRALFFFLGFGAMLWLLPWFALIPWGPKTSNTLASWPEGPTFATIAGKLDFWGTVVALFCGNYAWYFLLTWLPPYLEIERHFSKTTMAIFGSIPFWGIAFSSVVCGWSSDRLIERGWNAMRTRKTLAAIGLLLTNLILPSCMLSNHKIALAMMTAGCLAYGLFSSNCWAMTQTLAGPAAAGKWTGMQNCLGNVAGVAAPWITGCIVQSTGNFLLAFVAVSICLIMGASACLFLLSNRPIFEGGSPS